MKPKIKQFLTQAQLVERYLLKSIAETDLMLERQSHINNAKTYHELKGKLTALNRTLKYVRSSRFKSAKGVK